MKSLKLYVGQSLMFGSIMTFFQCINQKDELLRYFIIITVTYFVVTLVFDWLRKKSKRNKSE